MREPRKGASAGTGKLKLLVTLLPLIVLFGLGGCSYLDGYATSNYLKTVAQIQYGSDSALLSLNSDLADLSAGPDKTKAAVTRLTGDKDNVDKTLSQLSALEAPAEAQALKGHLLELYSEGSGLLGDLILTGNYRLKEEPLMSQYEGAASSFAAGAKSATDNKSLATCLTTYRDSVTSIDQKAEQLETPTLSRRSNMRFVFDLKTLSEGLSGMIKALGSGNQDQIKAASNNLAAADGSSASMKQQQQAEEAADACDYNLMVRHLNRLMDQIGRDEAALHAQFDRK